MKEREPAGATQRLDKWLFYAQFFNSRSSAARLCGAGQVRVNRMRVHKPHYALRVGDVLTFPQGRRIRVVRVQCLAMRRGPARSASALYEDLEPGGASSQGPGG